MTALAVASVALSMVVVGGYVAYTLAEWQVLRRWMDPRLRTLGLALAVALAVGSVLSDDTNVAPVVQATPFAVAIGAALYAWWRQWLLPRRELPLRETDVVLSADDLVAVLPDGNAVALGWLERVRTARSGDLVVAHCGLSLATAAFEVPQKRKMPAWLPHRSGFWIGGPAGLWDAVDGTPAPTNGASQPLRRAPVRVLPYTVWRRSAEGRKLLAPQPTPALGTGKTALMRSARGVPDGARLGVVSGETWRPVTAAPDLARPSVETSADKGEPAYYLARWAALARELPIQEHPRP